MSLTKRLRKEEAAWRELKLGTGPSCSFYSITTWIDVIGCLQPPRYAEANPGMSDDLTSAELLRKTNGAEPGVWPLSQLRNCDK